MPAEAKLIGRWFVPGIYGGHIAIYDNVGKLFVHHRYHDGSGSPDEVTAHKHKFDTAYKLSDSYDYFVVTAAGDLELWDNSGRLDHEQSEKMTK